MIDNVSQNQIDFSDSFSSDLARGADWSEQDPGGRLASRLGPPS